jgi:endonuclease/exonuclease/phosphatase family metal-dependent hydrolase
LLSRSGARRYWWIWVAVAPIVAWTVVRLLGLERGYPLVAIMVLTPYVAVGALFATGVATALRNWAAAVVAGVATVCLAVAIVPRTIGSPVDAAGHRELTVLAANIHHGTADPRALIALIDRYEPDLLTVQELTPSFSAKLRRAGIAQRFPHSMLRVHRNASGAGIYSRSPLTPLPHQTRFVFRMPRAVLELPSGPVRVICVHPYPPFRLGEWEDALASFPSAGTGAPWVLVGDFNATLDQAEFRAVIDSGYTDAGDATGRGLEPTWPVFGSHLPPITIDHVLADRRLGIADYGVDDLPGSDHRAIHAELVLP